jgi:hypothetical protein
MTASFEVSAAVYLRIPFFLHYNAASIEFRLFEAHYGLMFMEILTVEGKATTLPRKARIRLAIYSVSYPGGLES